MAYYPPYPRSVDQIFKDYEARRNAILRALIQEVDEFYRLCDPEKDNLCLYGHADGRWEVNFPPSEVPTKIPTPVIGINFTRDGMEPREWLSHVAIHSDSWLLSVAFFVGLHLNSNERERLFSLINDLPTIFEILTKWKPIKDGTTTDSGSKSCGSTERPSDGQDKGKQIVDNEKDEEKHSVTLCGICSKKYNASEFWIGCDVCERWFHGKCVKITPAKADSIERYKCPSCNIRRDNIYEIEKLVQK